ncbi:MAG: AAA family ATPase [Desulfuromonadales bacterium]|nr:AAA family ATPase [Desulfuromonadales bacterium]
MYESFFGLDEKPFNLTPNPHFLFLSEAHSEVYAHLLYGVENRSGFIMVSGEVGTGKTTILRSLLGNLDPSVYRIAFIFNPKLNASELLQSIAREFEIELPSTSRQELFDALSACLLEENRQGRVPVLVIDEAQNLSGDVLEQIRLLSNLETETAKLIQIVLVGQPELERQLNDPSLRQLNQRIAVRYRLTPLDSRQTGDYVLHRLKIAGRPDGNVFADGVLARIHRLSGGVPRMINLICDRAMLCAFSDGRGIVLAGDVRQAYRELTGLPARPAFNWQTKSPWALVGLLLLLVGVLVWRQLLPPHWSASAGVTSQPGTAAVQQEPAPAAGEVTVRGVALTARNALLAAWGKSPAAASLADAEVWQLHGLQLLTVRAGIDGLLALDLPFLLLSATNAPVSRQAVLAAADGRFHLVPGLADQSVLPLDQLRRFGLLEAQIPWIDHAAIGYVGSPGQTGDRVGRLQRLLQMAGYLATEPDNRYDEATIRAVKALQREQGLEADGVVGPKTLVALYRQVGGYAVPSLQGERR